MSLWRVGFLLLLMCTCALGRGQTAPAAKPVMQMVPVELNVKVEVLDWGGTGRTLFLLAGLGNDAYVFDKFAPLLTPRYHVYSMSRRGYGKSDAPAPSGENYSATRLGNDVVAVLDALKLVRPVVAGHSIAGGELSALGSQHADRVAGLVYLDAGYPYALYNPALGDWNVDQHTIRVELDAFAHALLPADGDKTLKALQRDLPRFVTEVDTRARELSALPPMTAAQMEQLKPRMQQAAVGRAIINSEERFTTLGCPVLAIFAEPHKLGKGATPEQVAKDVAEVEPQAKLFEALPGAKVIRVANADHFIFTSNPTEVVKAMDEFIGGLK